MIEYEYKCESCKSIKTIEYDRIPNDIPKKIKCEKCSNDMYRVFGKASTIIPEHFRATSSLYNNNTASDYHFMKHRLSKGSRPSGRQKIYY